MGGCRCTYRNCMAKTDGKIHMFHYPVFDKMRCHQWLINAHRHDFFNLKVSQLKNRVVCQHHFKDECFMNYKKEKLKFEAVPTENGPYCDPSKWNGNSQEFSKLYPIGLEHIENDYFSTDDKKANFSLKYLDFLTNSESIDLPYFKNKTNSVSIKQNDQLNNVDFTLDNNVNTKSTVLNQNNSRPDIVSDKLTLRQNGINKLQIKPVVIVSPQSEESLEKKAQDNECSQTIHLTYSNNKPEPAKRNSRVKIISEKKITNSFPLIGSIKFEPISPNFLLDPSKLQNNNLNKEKNISEKSKQDEIRNTTKKENISNSSQKLIQFVPENSNVRTLNHPHIYSTETAKMSILKNNLQPVRKTAIQEKRKCNIITKDVGSNVKKNEEPELFTENNTEQISDNNQQTVQNSSRENNVLENNDKSYLSFLEARMNRLENLLLNKIDQNSKSITDLKNSFTLSSLLKKKNVSTQTKECEEAHKNFLYTEISKYLSSKSKSLIYEELFLDKFGQNCNEKKIPQKRRKYR